MPAAKRKTAGKKRTGTAAAAKILLALSGDDGDGGGCDGGEDSRKQRRVEFIEGLVGDLKKKVDSKCEDIMNEQMPDREAMLRVRFRAKSSIPKQFRTMNLSAYCEGYGEDYDMVLFHSTTSGERERLLAKAREKEDENNEENNDPGTAIKGEGKKSRSRSRAVPQTPVGRRTGQPNGRATRSAMKEVPPPTETPSRTTRMGLRAANTTARTTRATRNKQNGTDARPTGSGPVSTASVTAVGAGGGGVVETVLDGEDLPASVCAELRKRANPMLTVHEHLDAIMQPFLDDIPRIAEEECEFLLGEFVKGAAILRSDGDGSCPVGMAVDASGDGAQRRQEEKDAAGGAAKVSLSAEGGRYDGKLFEISVEEGGDARMIGRSTGKKFKQHGVSLSKDSEVSISHGKFEKAGGKVTYQDVGSTNGTMVNEEFAEEGEAYEIVTGCKLVIGQGEYTVTIS